MTANQLISKLQKEVFRLNTGDIPVRINGMGFDDADVELVENNGDYYIELEPIYF